MCVCVYCLHSPEINLTFVPHQRLQCVVGVEGGGEFKVEFFIFCSEHRLGRINYLILWKGYLDTNHSWEVADDVHTLNLYQGHLQYQHNPRLPYHTIKLLRKDLFANTFMRKRDAAFWKSYERWDF